MDIREIPLGEITVSALNARKDLAAGNEDSSIEDLAASIKEKGLLSPITVRSAPAGGYELIAGQRRLLACRKLGMERVSAIIRSELDDGDAAAISIIENVHRAEMNPVDKARAFAALRDRYGGDLQRVSRETAVGSPTIKKYLALLSLPAAIQERISTSEGPARIDAMATLSRTFSSQDDMLDAYNKTIGFTQEIQKQIIRESEGDINRVDELVSQAQQGAFDTKLCRGLAGKLMCEYIPPDLADSVIDLVEKRKKEREDPVDVKHLAKRLRV